MPNDQTSEHRQHLVLAEQKAQEDYDKSILSLSGGALGISITFVEKIAGKTPTVLWMLDWAWICWVASVAFVVLSYSTSRWSLRCAIYAEDDPKSKFYRTSRDWLSVFTELFNVLSGSLFISGAILIAIFSSNNIEKHTVKESKAELSRIYNPSSKTTPHSDEAIAPSVIPNGYVPPPPRPQLPTNR